GPVGGRALAEDQGPPDPGAARGVDPRNRPARTPQFGPTGAFGDQDRLRSAVRNVGEARQVVVRQDALVIGCPVHETEIHQTGIYPPDAGIVAAGALAAVTVIERVFHGRDPAVRLRRRALHDLQLRGRHRLVLRALGTPVPVVYPGERLLFEVRQEE